MFPDGTKRPVSRCIPPAAGNSTRTTGAAIPARCCMALLLYADEDKPVAMNSVCVPIANNTCATMGNFANSESEYVVHVLHTGYMLVR